MDNSQLFQLQQQFQAYVFGDDDNFLQQIVEHHSGQAETRANIYADMYGARLYEALLTEYPASWKLFGETVFEDLAFDYIEQHPSQVVSLNDYTDGFASFLQACPQAKINPAAIEMAQFECMVSRVTLAKALKTLLIPQLKAIPANKWPRLKIIFQPSVMYYHFNYNISAFWQAHLTQQALPAIEKQQQSSCYIFWQYQGNPQYKVCDIAEGWMIAECYAGKTFAAVCQSLCELIDADLVPLLSGQILSSWVTSQMIHKIMVV